MKFFLYFALIIFFSSFVFSQDQAVVLRIATVVPEGSTWVKSLQNLDKEIRKTMNVQLIVYAGGTAGESKAIMEKIKYGQLDGGGFIGSSLGEICSKIRIMDIPYQYHSLEEWKYVFKNIRTDLTEEFEKANFMVLGWGHGGFVDVYAKQPIKTLADFQAAKIWFSPGDPVMEDLFRELKIQGIPLETSAIFPALQTGLVNCVYNTPYGLMAMQWHTHVRYCTKYPIVNPLGAVVLTKAAYQRIPAKFRNLFLRTCKKHFGALGEDVEEKNTQAVQDLQNRFKIQFLDPDPAWLEETARCGKKIGEGQIGKLYSSEFYQRVLKIQEEFRSQRK
ncbi:MAG: TRAP transporter substrate-binding protein DctP [Candidatus Brocadiae bacterium]|nr:TRAP transporter substrate-binding protein DctP [Candidatus Brocadiia bacterium]